MTKIDFITYVKNAAVRYRNVCKESIANNAHMNGLTELYGLDRDLIWGRGENELKKLKNKVAQNVPQDVVDAILVDFINAIGMEQGVDYAMYTRDLVKESQELKKK